MDRRSTRHRLTRLGIQVMLIGVFGILGGSLNGLNLLIVVAALILATLFAQWRMSRAMIDSLRIDRRMPVEAFAGKPVRIRYQVNNENRLLPLWLIRLEDGLQRMAASDTEAVAISSLTTRKGRRGFTTGFAKGRNGQKRVDGDLAVIDPRFQKTLTGVGLLMPRQTTSAFYDITTFHRGRYRLGRWHVSTIAPFALSMAYRESIWEEDFMDVYPRLLRLQRSWRRMLPSRVGNVSSTAQRQGPSDDVFFGLREYRHGDSPRHIHWRTTARLGEPAVRQFEQQRQYDLCLMVDAWSKGSTNPGEVESIDEMAERAISLAATVIVELSQGSQSRVLLVVAGREFEVVSGGSSPVGLRRMLQSLARVQVTAHVPLSEAMMQASASLKRLPDMVVMSSRSQNRAVAADAATSLALKRWKMRSQLTWVDVNQKDIARWIVEGANRT